MFLAKFRKIRTNVFNDAYMTAGSYGNRCTQWQGLINDITHNEIITAAKGYSTDQYMKLYFEVYNDPSAQVCRDNA